MTTAKGGLNADANANVDVKKAEGKMILEEFKELEGELGEVKEGAKKNRKGAAVVGVSGKRRRPSLADWFGKEVLMNGGGTKVPKEESAEAMNKKETSLPSRTSEQPQEVQSQIQPVQPVQPVQQPKQKQKRSKKQNSSHHHQQYYLHNLHNQRLLQTLQHHNQLQQHELHSQALYISHLETEISQLQAHVSSAEMELKQEKEGIARVLKQGSKEVDYWKWEWERVKGVLEEREGEVERLKGKLRRKAIGKESESNSKNEVGGMWAGLKVREGSVLSFGRRSRRVGMKGGNGMKIGEGGAGTNENVNEEVEGGSDPDALIVEILKGQVQALEVERDRWKVRAREAERKAKAAMELWKKGHDDEDEDEGECEVTGGCHLENGKGVEAGQEEKPRERLDTDVNELHPSVPGGNEASNNDDDANNTTITTDHNNISNTLIAATMTTSAFAMPPPKNAATVTTLIKSNKKGLRMSGCRNRNEQVFQKMEQHIQELWEQLESTRNRNMVLEEALMFYESGGRATIAESGSFEGKGKANELTRSLSWDLGMEVFGEDSMMTASQYVLAPLAPTPTPTQGTVGIGRGKEDDGKVDADDEEDGGSPAVIPESMSGSVSSLASASTLEDDSSAAIKETGAVADIEGSIVSNGGSAGTGLASLLHRPLARASALPKVNMAMMNGGLFRPHNKPGNDWHGIYLPEAYNAESISFGLQKRANVDGCDDDEPDMPPKEPPTATAGSIAHFRQQPALMNMPPQGAPLGGWNLSQHPLIYDRAVGPCYGGYAPPRCLSPTPFADGVAVAAPSSYQQLSGQPGNDANFAAAEWDRVRMRAVRSVQGVKSVLEEEKAQKRRETAQKESSLVVGERAEMDGGKKVRTLRKRESGIELLGNGGREDGFVGKTKKKKGNSVRVTDGYTESPFLRRLRMESMNETPPVAPEGKANGGVTSFLEYWRGFLL
jgi:hypothetical protein